MYNYYMEISQQYVGAIVIVIISVLRAFKIEIASDAVTGIVTGLIAVWIAVKRYQKGDISVSGVKK